MVNFGGFFAKLGQFPGFSLHIIKNVVRISEAAMGGKGDITFSARFFLNIIRRRISEAAMSRTGVLGHM